MALLFLFKTYRPFSKVKAKNQEIAGNKNTASTSTQVKFRNLLRILVCTFPIILQEPESYKVD